MGKHKNSADAKIWAQLKAKELGWVFTPSDLAGLGSRTAVATALKRYKATGRLRQVARGLYCRVDSGTAVGPTVDAVIRAVKDRDAVRLQPSGAYAANQLGLSDQVPMRVVFLTDGRQQRIKLGKMEILFKRTTPRNMATAGRVSGLVIQAFRWLGQRQAVAAADKLKALLDAPAKNQLLADARHAPVWMAKLFHSIAEPAGKGR
jgi:hypothetical protein